MADKAKKPNRVAQQKADLGWKDKPAQRGMKPRHKNTKYSKFATFMHSLSFPVARGRISQYAKWSGPPFAGFYKGQYQDAPTAEAQAKKLFIYFYSVITGHQVYFPAFIEQLSDTFTPEWQSEHIYGRGDPIHNYAGTERKISLSWALPASDSEEGIANIARANKLITFMYPPTEATGFGEYISGSPFVRVKFSNLIQNASKNGWSEDQGLLCTIDSLTWEPEVESGWFDGDEHRGVSRDVLIPKVLRISLALSVHHEHFTGWTYDPNGRTGFPNDPYNSAGKVAKMKGGDPNLEFGSFTARDPFAHANWEEATLDSMLHPGDDAAQQFPSIPDLGTGPQDPWGEVLERSLDRVDNKTKRMYDKMLDGNKILGIQTKNKPGITSGEQKKYEERQKKAEEIKQNRINRYANHRLAGKEWKI